MAAYLFLPRNAQPPFPAVIFWPGSNALSLRSFDMDGLYTNVIGFLPRAGYALVMPLLMGTWERDDSAFTISGAPRNGSVRERELKILWHKEVRRTLDYLEARPDIDGERFGFYGISWGGREGSIALAVEPRFRAAVLNVGGLGPNNYALPEIDGVNYLPRVRTPTLMLNGRHDIVFPYASSQLPFFRLLGTPAADKKHVAYPATHFIPQPELVRESLAWFGKYLARGTSAP
jgi:dienelactone hydrolase